MFIQNKRTVPFAILKFHVTDLAIYAAEPTNITRIIKFSALIRKGYAVKRKGVGFGQHTGSKYFGRIARRLLSKVSIFGIPYAFLCV